MRYLLCMDLKKQCLCLSLSERSRFSEGEIQTFMSVDSDRTINLCNSLHDAWRYPFSLSNVCLLRNWLVPHYLMSCVVWHLLSLPLQIGVALYLLYTQVNYAFLSGLAITVILMPGTAWFSMVLLYISRGLPGHALQLYAHIILWSLASFISFVCNTLGVHDPMLNEIHVCMNIKATLVTF